MCQPAKTFTTKGTKVHEGSPNKVSFVNLRALRGEKVY